MKTTSHGVKVALLLGLTMLFFILPNCSQAQQYQWLIGNQQVTDSAQNYALVAGRIQEYYDSLHRDGYDTLLLPGGERGTRTFDPYFFELHLWMSKFVND